MTFTEQERTMSGFELARLAGYNSRYQGRPIETVSHWSERSVAGRAWREGWREADAELNPPQEKLIK